ncbi:MAG: hypothetical protein P1R58_02545 [bacterium]|nr:hypothetical protein [bacterium]
MALFYTLPYFLELHNWGIRDWDLFSTITAVPIGSIIDYGQFPFWNPYLLGGNILFHHPEVAVFSPFIFVHWLFGVIIGLKIQVAVCYLIGFWGSYRLAQSIGISRIGSVLVSLSYFGSIHFALHFAEGHLPFTHFCFLPWFVLLVKESIGRPSRAVLAAGILCLMILGNGAAVPLLYTTLFSSLYFLGLAIQESEWKYLRNLALAGLGGLALSAVKAVPMIVYLYQNQWAGSPHESIPFSALGSIFFGYKHSLLVQNFPEQVWAWHEYGAFISPLLVLLGLVALWLAFRRSIIWLALLLFFLALGLGDHGALSPWSILSHLPGFSSARATGRAFQFVIMAAAFTGGIGFDLLVERFKRRGRNVQAVPIITAGIIVLTNLLLAWPVASEAFRRAPQYVHRSDLFEQTIEGSQTAYRNYLQNRGSLVAPVLSAYHPSRALVDQAGNVMSEFVQAGAATVLFKEYTPNRITYSIDGTQPGEMIVGMGFDVGWTVEDGRRLTSRDGLIVVPFGPGTEKIVLEYRTPYFYHGLLISLISLVGFLLVLFQSRRISALIK